MRDCGTGGNRTVRLREREIEAEESPTASTIVRRRQNMCLYLEEGGGGEEEVDKMSISVSRYIYFSYC